tara:strand:+ start:292 stop:642 length:351 start_codon:yes stop_codon:yes gene_type:complete
MAKTKRVNKASDGKYHVSGKVFEKLVGSRAQVWHDTAYKTTGGLKKSDLLQNANGRIVSKSKSVKSKQEKGSRFKKAGYSLAKKGKFGPVRSLRSKTKSVTRSRTSKRRKSLKRTV